MRLRSVDQMERSHHVGLERRLPALSRVGDGEGGRIRDNNVDAPALFSTLADPRGNLCGL